jgi:glycosyltransferase involved in cell wall biosynthesis
VRIAIATWSRRRVGGIETYLGGTISGLHAAGHDLAFWSELDQPADRLRITLPTGVPAWSVSDLGAECALTALRDWHPDVIYSHGLLDPDLEARLLTIAPAVFCAHAYHGTCISGAKTFKFPVVTPCNRQFGWQCLMHYYPHRCGGWSPVTMVKEFRRQSERLKLLRRYKAIITYSSYMNREYEKYGLAPKCIPLSSAGKSNGNGSYLVSDLTADTALSRIIGLQKQDLPMTARTLKYWHLIFLGRMDYLKGGRLFLEALPQVAASLDRAVRVTFAGDGPDRIAWERQAKQVNCRGLDIAFAGWVVGRQFESLLADSDLLVVPSLWPEPLGLVGAAAGRRGIPAVAFAVGGIPEWLSDGVNGFLAPGNPPTAAGLSEAIIRALHHPQTHARLRQGALERAKEHTLLGHLAQLLPVLEKYAR